LMKVRRPIWGTAVSFESELFMSRSSLTGEPSVSWWRSAALHVREPSPAGWVPRLRGRDLVKAITEIAIGW
jgi:hypothetical protein